MSQHRGNDMRLIAMTLCAVLFYAVVLGLALLFAPQHKEYTKDVREVRAFIYNCEGHATISQVLDEYEMVCKEK